MLEYIVTHQNVDSESVMFKFLLFPFSWIVQVYDHLRECKT